MLTFKQFLNEQKNNKLYTSETYDSPNNEKKEDDKKGVQTEGILNLFQKRREKAKKELQQKHQTHSIMRDNPKKPKLNAPETGPESRGFGKKDALPKPTEKAFDPRKRYPKDVRGIGPITTSGYRQDIA